MTFQRAYTGARILETNENYASADAPLTSTPERTPADRNYFFSEDSEFWEAVFWERDRIWGATIELDAAAVSEWVARVPGLFWKPEMRELRELRHEKHSIVGGWKVYDPPLKSRKVMGGVGTMRLPMAPDGSRLISLCTSLNASAGIPALISSEIWHQLTRDGPAEGRLIGLHGARWIPMSQGWASRFPSTREIPRGYLVLESPDRIFLRREVAPVLIHPFTVMEYREGPRELFDFVYATADTSKPDYRRSLERFFGWYAGESGRRGRYLLTADMLNPMWEARYESPAELRRDDPAAGSQLALLEERVRRSMLGDDAIDWVLEALGRVARSPADFERLSADIDIEFAVWYRGGTTPAETSSLFVEEVLRDGGQDKLLELIEVLARRHPALLQEQGASNGP